jgi:hypothetical protein
MRQNNSYVEGAEAMENFEKGMKALFKVPKDAVVKAKKKQKVTSRGKPPKPDKD